MENTYLKGLCSSVIGVGFFLHLNETDLKKNHLDSAEND